MPGKKDVTASSQNSSLYSSAVRETSTTEFLFSILVLDITNF